MNTTSSGRQCTKQMNSMKKVLFMMVLSVLALVSCAPLTYTLSVEKMVPSVADIDLSRTLPGILVLDGDDDSDSLLLSALAIGMAEGLETSLGIDTGAVPVYTMYAGDVNISDSASIPYLHDLTGVDVLFLVDSLKVGDFSVTYPEERSYLQNQIMRQTIVKLPYSVSIKAFDVMRSDSAVDLSESDIFEWALLSDTQIQSLRAIEKVDGELEEYFTSIGRTITTSLAPRWEAVDVTVYVYDNSQWTEACRLAYLFEWEKAMDIWLREADSPDIRKAACAAHNISVACEILDMRDMAARWKERSEELFGKL